MSDEEKGGEHFDADKKCKIHTSRSNKAKMDQGCSPTDQGTCNYSDKLPKLEPKDTKGHSNVHHLLSIGPVNDYGKHAKAEAIEALYRGTEWCISHSDNLLRMPHKRHYLEVYVKGGSRKHDPEKEISVPLPCHDVHHHLYL